MFITTSALDQIGLCLSLKNRSNVSIDVGLLCKKWEQTWKKIVGEYDQEIPQSQTADKPMVPRGRATQPSLATRETNKAKQPALSLPHQDACKTRMGIT